MNGKRTLMASIIVGSHFRSSGSDFRPAPLGRGILIFLETVCGGAAHDVINTEQMKTTVHTICSTGVFIFR